ncbi:MAG: glycosyl hydrolase family 28-related protein, partial [Bdellovibrionales bacterium]
ASSSGNASSAQSNTPTYSGLYDVQNYGATGNGSTDDTNTIQSAIDAAQVTGGIVFFPPGSYKTSSSLNVSARIKISGVGYQGDGGRGYLGQGVTQTSGFTASVIVCASSHHGIVVTTNDSIVIEGLQITYPSQPSSGTTGIILQANQGAGNSNTDSILRDVMIAGHSVGIQMINCLDFVIDNCKLMLGWNSGITLASPNYPSYGDSTITNCAIWGNGVPSYTCHIGVFSGGGLRIINNKFNFGNGTKTDAILISPNLSVLQNVEPLLIANNSIEGSACGIVFNNANPNGTCSAVTITGNEIWAGVNAILANTFGTGQWLVGFSIVGNTLMVNGGGSGNSIVVLDSASIGIITGNMFSLARGGTGTAISLGPRSVNINVQSNVYGPGLTPAADNGSGNKVGGGSA